MWDMIKKPRIESVELRRFRSMDIRTNLSVKEKSYYLNLEKGFQGEKIFDEWMESLTIDCLILNDLLFEHSNTFFQVDSLIMLQDIIHFFEIKYFEGDYIIKNDEWHFLSGKEKEIKNPLLQLKRSASLLRRVLQDLGCHLPVEEHLIFVKPDFYLYQAPINLPIIFPSQIERFIDSMNKKSSNLTSYHSKLANQLLSLHVDESPFIRVPKYSFDQLKKGITCDKCKGFIDHYEKYFIVCPKCGHKENITSAVLRSIEEYCLLFPNKKLTTNSIQEWCKITSHKTIQRVLSTHFKQLGHGKSTYYIRNN
ncbi:hypothetical protein B5V89_11110 [Heyndrickxia sporothermodurans]|nr:hypothetical protein B5V89_11110 [Heyndrickxia sporothermodurans]